MAKTQNAAKGTENEVVNSIVTTNETPELSNLMVSAPTTKKPLADRLNVFFELEKLFDKRHQILEALEKVNGFQIGSTGGENLRLMDAKGATFAISHPIIIGEMVAMAKAKLQAALQDVENQFDF